MSDQEDSHLTQEGGATMLFWLCVVVYEVVAGTLVGTQSDEDSNHDYWVLN
jgi:hypothetical protein